LSGVNFSEGGSRESFASASIDEMELRRALEAADIRVLLMVLVHLTGDHRWMEAPYLPVRDTRLFADESAGLDPALQAEVREAVFCEILSDDLTPAIPRPTPEQLLEMMSVCLGETVKPEYVPLVLEEMGFASPLAARTDERAGEPVTAVVIGAGISGLCAAIRFHHAGIPFTVLERNDAVGGVWWENVYPDCGVDTPNHFYSYSFAPNHGWNHYFSPRDEIHAYLDRCADEFNVRDHIRFGVTVDSAIWNEDEQRWEVQCRTADGAIEHLSANVLVAAVGQMNRPKFPTIEGLEDFAGPVFHSARWQRDTGLVGKRVAVIGTGASAMQFVPTLADEVADLTIFQRSPQWARPIDDYHRTVGEGTKWLLHNVPFYAPWYRFSLFWRFGDGLHRALQIDPTWEHPERSINKLNDRHRVEIATYIEAELGHDPELIAKALPDYPPWGKRMLVDNGWFRALTRPNVHLVTELIASADATGVATSDGVHHDVDVIVLATGFHASDPLGAMDIRGRDGRHLGDQWAGNDPRAYLGITVPNFPNMFVLYGPNTNLGHGGSIIFQAECQVHYTISLLEEMRTHGLASIEVKQDVHDDYIDRVDAAHQRMVWSHQGMQTWYRNAAGRVVTNSPWRLVDYWAWTHDPKLDDYEVRSGAVTGL
jgi:4-hydroxyacetophenone monooxygenase